MELSEVYLATVENELVSMSDAHTEMCRIHLLNLENTVKDCLTKNGKSSKATSLMLD